MSLTGMLLGYFRGKMLLAAASFAASFALLEVSFGAFAPPFALAAYSALVAAAAPHFASEYSRGSRIKALEAGLPGALFAMSSLPQGAPFEKSLAAAASTGGEAGKEFGRILSLLERGVMPSRAFPPQDGRASPEFGRAAGVLRLLYERGSAAGEAVRMMAEDSLSSLQLSSERDAVLSMQRYTLYASSALLVPFICGSMLRSAAELSAPSDGSLATFSVALPLYLVEFAALASLFAAHAEGNIKKAAVLFTILAPVSLLVFVAASGGFSA